jgi:hypothetical protein
MMSDHDRFDRVGPIEGQANAAESSTAPIIIVQRGRSGWGRELLLLLLLVATASYIFYQEYRGPSIIVRNESRPAAREVDSVAVAPVSRGELVVRAPGDRPVEAADEAANSDPDSAPAVEPARPVELASGDDSEPEPEPGIGDAPGPDFNVEAGPSVAAEAGFPPGPEFGDLLPELQHGIDRPEAGTGEAPKRSSSVIVWDEERRNGPAERDTDTIRRPFQLDGAPQPAPAQARADLGAARELDRRFVPQTPAQRRLFHQGLVTAIRQYGRDAGPHIDGLAREFFAPLPEEILILQDRYGTNLVPLGRELEDSVIALRKIGAPESFLLEQLTEQLGRTIGARKGPRDMMEARVFAARKLLAIPLPSPDDEQAAARRPPAG